MATRLTANTVAHPALRATFSRKGRREEELRRRHLAIPCEKRFFLWP
jgi:hypothetical protein